MRWTACALALALTVAGCSSAPVGRDGASGRAVSALQDFEVSGRIALQTANGADTAALVWQQTGNRDIRLTLSGPLGMQATTLRKRDGEITLERGGEVRRVVPEQLLVEQGFNWPLPLDELGWWLRGLPAPEPRSTATRVGGRLQRLTQSGWTLEYDDYSTQGALSLPRRVRFSGPDVSGKLLLKNWTFPQ